MSGEGFRRFSEELHSVYWDEAGERARAERLSALERRAKAEPDFDYFEQARPRWPKYEVGKYVASQGFSVPLIEADSQWRAAYHAERAMLRSELGQDYDGLSGLFSSAVLSRKHLRHLYIAGTSDMFKLELAELLYRAIGDGDLDPLEYMRTFEWEREGEHANTEEAWRYGVTPEDYYPEVSPWTYIPGANIRMFRDTAVDDRYHIAISPEGHYAAQKLLTIDSDAHGEVINYTDSEGDGFNEPVRYFEGQPIAVAELIEYYEAIRALPRFDARQAPLLELVMDRRGKLHFLQYLKTGQLVAPVEHFELPEGDGTLITANVRGATVPEGRQTKIYLGCRGLDDFVPDEATYLSAHDDNRIGAQVASKMCDIIISAGYLSFKDSHSDSAPLYRPKIGIGLWQARRQAGYEALEQLDDQARYHEPSSLRYYVNATVTSNGREASIESDWQLRMEER